MTKLLTVDQVAKLLAVSPKTVYRWAHEQYVPHFKLGTSVRFSEDQLLSWIKDRQVAGRPLRVKSVY